MTLSSSSSSLGAYNRRLSRKRANSGRRRGGFLLSRHIAKARSHCTVHVIYLKMYIQQVSLILLPLLRLLLQISWLRKICHARTALPFSRFTFFSLTFLYDYYFTFSLSPLLSSPFVFYLLPPLLLYVLFSLCLYTHFFILASLSVHFVLIFFIFTSIFTRKQMETSIYYYYVYSFCCILYFSFFF